MANRWLAWWRAAEATVVSLSEPRIDRAAADADVYAIIAGSRMFTAVAAVGAVVRQAWIQSRTRRAVEHAQRQTGAGSLADRIRVVAQCTIVAAVTVLLLLPAGTASGRRFQTLVPLAVGALALVTARAAGPIACAWLGKRM